MEEQQSQPAQAAGAARKSPVDTRHLHMGQVFRTSTVIQWGSTFTTNLPTETVLNIISTEARRMGYVVESQTCGEESFAVKTRLHDPLWKALVRRLPALVTWRLWREGDTTFIYCDSQLSASYSTIIYISCALCAVLFWFGWTTLLLKNWLTVPAAHLYGFGVSLIAALSLFFVNYGLVVGASSERLAPIFTSLRRDAMSANTYLAQTGRRISLRHLLYSLSYLVFVGVLITLALLRTGVAIRAAHPQAWTILVLATLIVLLTTLVVSLPLLVRFEGFSARLLPSLGGMNISMAMLILYSAQLPWVIGQPDLSRDNARTIASVRSFIHGDWNGPPLTWPDGTLAQRAQVINAYGPIRVWASCVFVGSVFLLTFAVFFWIRAFDAAFQAWPLLYQMRKRPEIPWTQQTTRASGFLRPFRITWGASGILLALCFALLLIGLGKSTIHLIGAVNPSQPSPTLNTIETAALFSAIVFDAPPDNPLLTAVVHATWGLYLFVCLGFLVVSVGSFFVQETNGKRRLGKTDEPSDPNIQNLVQRLAESLRTRSSLISTPEVILIHSRLPFAQARSVGLMRTQRVIELSDRCIEEFTEQELYALLAHETAHHHLGHCRKDQVLRLLGRTTFLGDGFVRVLEDSFGYEMKADRFAVAELGADPQALIGCLQKLRIITAIENLQAVSRITGLALPGNADDPDQMTVLCSSLTWWERLKLGATFLVEQYFGLKHSGYWHPPVTHRIAALQTFQPARVRNG
jgi:Zn-dependent protease with chaperone function